MAGSFSNFSRALDTYSLTGVSTLKPTSISKRPESTRFEPLFGQRALGFIDLLRLPPCQALRDRLLRGVGQLEEALSQAGLILERRGQQI